MADSFQQVLNDSLELLRQGIPLEECLSRYPEHAKELEPLLRTALITRAQLTAEIPSAARTRIRARILEEWDRRHLPRQRRWNLPSLLPRWAAIAAAVVLAIVFGGVGTVAAARSALPGDPLYPVKEFREEIQLWFALSPQAKVTIYGNLVKERAKELRELAASKRTESSSIALARLERHVSDVNHLLEADIASTGTTAGEAPALQEKLQAVIDEQRSAELVVQEVMESASAEARPELQRAVELIQRSRQRVRSALEALGPYKPLAPTPVQGGEN